MNIFAEIKQKLSDESYLTTNDDGETTELSDCVVSLPDALNIIDVIELKFGHSELGYVSKTKVIQLIESIKNNPEYPKNYGTLLDILRHIRKLSVIENEWNYLNECDESYPRVGEQVLARDKDGNLYVAACDCMYYWSVSNGEDSLVIPSTIIAWKAIEKGNWNE